MSILSNLAKNNRGAGLIAIIVILLILGSGGYFAYIKYMAKKGPGADFGKDFKHITSKEEILLLTYYKLPKIYRTLVDFENEVILITAEIARLNEMEKKFPQQLNIIAEEKNIWTEARSELINTFSQIENEIEALYVSYRVNTVKGTELIEDKREELLSLASDQIKVSKELTDRLKKPAAKKKKFYFF